MPNLVEILIRATKDAGGFADVDSALGAMGSKLTSIGTSLSIATAPIAGFFAMAVKQASDEQTVLAQLNQVIKSTGGVAGVTAQSADDLANSLEKVTRYSNDTILGAENMLLTFCLEQNAEALVKDKGWVHHDQMEAGDEILAYDPEDGTIRWEPIESMHRFQVNGDLIRWKSKQMNVATTPHHRWWTTARTTDRSGNEPVSRMQTHRFRTTSEVSDHQVAVMIGGGQSACFAEVSTLSDDLVRLLGWVVTEGWFRYSPKSPNFVGVAFTQSITANPENVESIRSTVQTLVAAGNRISERARILPYNDSTALSWFFAGDLGRAVRELLPNKKLSVELIQRLTRAQAAMLLDVLICADGSVDHHGHRQYIQKDLQQLDMIALLCAMLGIRTSMLGREDSIYLCETNYAWGHQLNAQPEHYEGVVWCPHLRTGIFMARCNGKTFWTGNTNISSNIFPDVTKVVLDLSTAMNEDLKSASIQVGKALNDPVAGMSALARVGVQFTQAQKDMVKSMVDAGNTAGAQAIILKELQREFGGSAEAAGQTFPGAMDILNHKFDDFSKTIGNILIPIIQKVTGFVGDLLDKVVEWSKANPVLLQTIVLIGGALVVAGPLLISAGLALTVISKIIPLITTALTFLLSPIGLVIGAITLLGVAFATNFLGIRDFLQPIVDKVLDIFGRIKDGIQDFVKDVQQYNLGYAILKAFGVAPGAGGGESWVEWVLMGFGMTRDAAHATVTSIGADILKIQNAFEGLKGFFGEIGAAFTKGGLFGAINQFFAGLEDGSTVITNFLTTLGMTPAAAQSVSDAIGKVVGVIDQVFQPLKPLFDAATSIFAAFQDSFQAGINTLLFYAGYFGGKLVSALGLDKLWATVQPMIQPILNWFIGSGQDSLSGVLSGIPNTIQQFIIAPLVGLWRGVLQPALQPIVDWFRDSFFPAISILASWINTFIVQPIITLWNTLQPLVNEVVGVVVLGIHQIFQPFIDIVNGILDDFEKLRRAGGGTPMRTLPGESSPGVTKGSTTVGGLNVWNQQGTNYGNPASYFMAPPVAMSPAAYDFTGMGYTPGGAPGVYQGSPTPIPLFQPQVPIGPHDYPGYFAANTAYKVGTGAQPEVFMSGNSGGMASPNADKRSGFNWNGNLVVQGGGQINITRQQFAAWMDEWWRETYPQ